MAVFSKQRMITIFHTHTHPDLRSTAGLVRAIEAAVPVVLGLLKDESSAVSQAAIHVVTEMSKERKISCFFTYMS